MSKTNTQPEGTRLLGPPPMDGTEDNPVIYFDHNGAGPNVHICAEVSASERARGWLDRQRLLGFVSAADVAVVERLIEDLR